MQKKLIKLLFIFHGLLVSIMAICPDSPTLPTGGTILNTDHFIVTPTSAGMSNFPTSTTKLSILGTITANEACAAGSVFNLFSLTVIPTSDTEKEVFNLYVECSTGYSKVKGDWATKSFSQIFPSTAEITTVSFAVTIDLTANAYRTEMYTIKGVGSSTGTSSVAQSWSFDSTTQINICSEKQGANPISCTVSDFKIVYDYFGITMSNFIDGYAQGSSPTLAASYALTDGSFDDSLGSSNSAYFGDGTTPATSPSWESSNAFVQLAQQGQFLTFPLPTLQASLLTTSYTLSLAAWIRVTSIPSTQATIFSTHKADGTESGYKLMVQSSLQLKMTIGGITVSTISTFPSVTLGSWQLIGFSMGPGVSNKAAFGTAFIDSTSCQLYAYNVADFGLASATLLRIGGATQSFVGDISTVRIITPAGGFIRSSGTCSPLNSIELGTGTFPLTCSGSNPLNMLDGKCYASCPADSQSFSDGAVPICACPAHCATCDSTQCLTCHTNYLLYQKACVDPCPAKTYSTATTCVDCPTHCATCDSTQCLTCDDSNYFVYNKACVNSCPAKMYSTGTTCQDCSDHCTECDASECKVCEDNYEISSGKCVLPSPNPSSSPSSAITSSSNHLSVGAIVAISVGSVVILTVLALGVHLWKKKQILLAAKKTMTTSNKYLSGDESPIVRSPGPTETGQMLP